MGIFKIITYIAGAITLGLAGYLYQLIDETGYLSEVAAIPADDIMYFHIFAAIVIAWLVVSFLMKLATRALVVALLVVSVGVETTFLGLNLNGSIVEQTIDVDELMDKGKDLLDDLSDSLD